MTQLRAGTAAPAFTLPRLGGSDFTFDPRGDGIRVLIFYKASCPACQYGMPLFDRLYRHFGGNGTHVYGLAQETVRDTAAFVSRFDLRMPQLIDAPPHAVSRAYGLLQVPTMVVVDANGHVQLVSPAFVKADLETVASWLAQERVAPPPRLFGSDEAITPIKPG